MSDNAISLYFGLKKGERADLEVVAAAAIEWVATIRAAAVAIDPSAQVRIELVDANESSLRLNALFEWAEDQLARVDRGFIDYPRLRKLAIALAVFLIIDAGPAHDFWFGDPPNLELSEDDRARIDEMIMLIQDSSEVEAPKRRFFKTLDRDPSITSVGIAEGRDADPIITIPNTEFAERGGLWAITEDEQERTVYSVLDVILISPVLLSVPRTWKFQQPEGLPEFSAVMRDERFLAALELSHVRERLRTGIEMTIRLRVKEHKVGGSWMVKRGGRSIVEVIAPKID